MVAFTTILAVAHLPLLALCLPQNGGQATAQSASDTANDTGFAPSTWVHPGVVVSKAQLDYAKSQFDAKAEPQTTAYNKMLEDKDKYGLYAAPSATRTSNATATVKCGPTTNPDIGCTDERGDALAAWANALAGYVGGDEQHTKNAIDIMNKWSHVITGERPFSYQTLKRGELC